MKNGAPSTNNQSTALARGDSVNEPTVLEERNNDVTCPLMTRSMYVERKDADTSLISPCCAARGELVDNSDLDFYTNPFLHRLRQENAAGLASSECQVCWDQEKFTGHSLRTSSLEKYRETRDQTQLITLDWNVEPICNAKCIICSNYHSSAWLAEDQKFNHATYPVYRTAASARHNDIIDSIDLSSLERVYFNGGEPVLSQDPVRILTRLKNIGRLHQVSVGFNMNGSRMPSDELTSLLREAQHVTVFFSIDGTGQQFEYIRYPIQWSVLEQNLASVLDLGFDDVCMTTALGIHNVHIAHDTEQWWMDFTRPWHNLVKIYNTYQLVVGPLALSTASPALRDQIMPGLDPSLRAENFAMNCLQAAQGQDQWIGWLNLIDHRRELDWRITLPGLYHAAHAAGVVK